MERVTVSENRNFNPTLPLGKCEKSPRKKQIEMKYQTEIRKQGIPNRQDFITFCQIQYFRIVKLRKYFTQWANQHKTITSESSSFLFADVNKLLEFVDETVESELEIPQEPEEEKHWTELQITRPRIQPPRRDSELKRFLRDLVPSKQFHALQSFQAKGLTFPDIIAEYPDDDFRRMVIDLINETNRTIDASQFFYEMYLSYLEYELNGGDEDEPGPWAILDKVSEIDTKAQEEEQVQLIIDYADALLFNQMSSVLNV